MSISLGVNAGNVNESYKKAMSISLGVITQIRVQSSWSPWLDVGCLDVSWLNMLLEGWIAKLCISRTRYPTICPYISIHVRADLESVDGCLQTSKVNNLKTMRQCVNIAVNHDTLSLLTWWMSIYPCFQACRLLTKFMNQCTYPREDHATLCECTCTHWHTYYNSLSASTNAVIHKPGVVACTIILAT